MKRELPHGLLFPASPAFSNNGEFLYVTNLDLGLARLLIAAVSGFTNGVRRSGTLPCPESVLVFVPWEVRSKPGRISSKGRIIAVQRVALNRDQHRCKNNLTSCHVERSRSVCGDAVETSRCSRL
jgi:hypothetical protein